jgi:probable biosynthetic protein (TIGR04098 family)
MGETEGKHATWNGFSLNVGMPHLDPGAKLSEVEFYKLLAYYQWESISRALDTPPAQIASDAGERLYASFIDIEVGFGPDASPEYFGEGANIFVKNRINVFADRFVEGLFLFADEPIPDAMLEKVKTREDLKAVGLPWAYGTNVFIARLGGNTKLKVFKPAGIEGAEVSALAESPVGIDDQKRAQSQGVIDGVEAEGTPIPLVPRIDAPIRYRVIPESDLNGAGLLYFVRYIAMCNYAERRFLTEHLSPPTSSAFTACLSVEERKTVFFGNAGADDEIDLYVTAHAVLPEDGPPHVLSTGHRRPVRFLFRIDLYRVSDKSLIASTLVRKGAHVPGDQKAVLAEAERLLHRLR